MPFGQSLIAGFIAGEVAGYVAEKLQSGPKDVRVTKCVVATGVGSITSIVTADPVGIVGSLILGTAYIAGYDPMYLIVESLESITNSKSKS